MPLRELSFFDVLDPVLAIVPGSVVLTNVCSLLEKNMEDTWFIIWDERERLASEKDYTFVSAALHARDHGTPMRWPRIFILQPSNGLWLDGLPLSSHVVENGMSHAKVYAKTLKDSLVLCQVRASNNFLTMFATFFSESTMSVCGKFFGEVDCQSAALWVLVDGVKLQECAETNDFINDCMELLLEMTKGRYSVY